MSAIDRPARQRAAGAVELWHPRGVAGEPADVVVVAPDSGGDLIEAIRSAAGQLADDGVLWVVVERGRRRRAARALAREGLVLRERVLMLPGWPATEHFVPLEAAPVHDAAFRHLDVGPLRLRGLAALVRTAAGRHALARLVPGSALVATRSAATPLRGWLADLEPAAGPISAAVACSGRRDARVATVLRFVSGRREPDLVVKLGLDESGDERVRMERAALAELAGAAAEAGFEVPAQVPAPDDAMLVMRALPGASAAWGLRHRRLTLERLVPPLAERLLVFARATARTEPVTRERLAALLVDPAERIAHGSAYVEALRGLAARVEREARLVVHAAHSDLTMANVLVADETLALIDWESATADGVALGDLWYALADAVACARGISHARAVELLVVGDDSIPSKLRELPARHAQALGLSADQSMLSFHACWLQHAADELDRGLRGPFLDVVETVGYAKLQWPG